MKKYNLLAVAEVAGTFQDGKKWTGRRLCVAAYQSEDADTASEVKIFKCTKDFPEFDSSRCVYLFFDEYQRACGYEYITA